MVEHAADLVRSPGAVVGAGCGKDALAILEGGERIDLMLCDVILPGGLDGIDVGMQAKALRPDLKVLFMSGYMQADMLQHRGLADGFHMIAKPFTLDELTEKLEEVWKSSTASSPEGQPSDQLHQ